MIMMAMDVMRTTVCKNETISLPFLSYMHRERNTRQVPRPVTSSAKECRRQLSLLYLLSEQSTKSIFPNPSVTATLLNVY